MTMTMTCLDLNCPCDVEERCPAGPEEVAYHTEVIVDGQLKIPDVKPPLENLIEVTHKICIENIRTIPVKLDNGCLTGCKVLVNGKVWLGIEYSADVPEQNVHFAHFEIPFQALITGGPCHKPIPLWDCNLEKFELHVCVEHIQVHAIDSRNLEKAIVLLLWLKRKHPSGGDHHHCSGGKKHHHCSGHHDTGEPCSSPPDVSKELAINHSLKIPPQKPPAECILDSTVEIEICKAEVINTPLYSSCCRVPIKKVVVTGKAELTVKYVAQVPDQQVHAAVFTIPFETLIEWPGGPPAHTPVCINVTEEYFRVDLIDPLNIFKIILLRLDVYNREARLC